MKHLLLLIFAFSTTLVYSQDLVLSPSPATNTGLSSNLYIKVISTVTNNTSNAMDVIWERYNVQMPSTWDNAVCDKNNCYDSSVDTEIFNLAPGEAGTMAVWFLPNNEAGTGTAEIRVYNVADSLNTVVSNTYTGLATTSTNNENLQESKFKVFPNPASNFVQLPQNNEIASVRLYDILGKMIMQEAVELGSIDHINVSDLNIGTYLLQFLDNEKNILHTTRVIKQ